jgi:hypothetical protein
VAASAWAASMALSRDFKATLSEQLGRYAEEACVVIDNQDPNRHIVMVPSTAAAIC